MRIANRRSLLGSRGMVLYLVLMVGAFAGLAIYNYAMLSQGEIRHLTRTELLVRVEIGLRSVYYDITNELRVSPWEKRSFKAGPKYHSGFTSDGTAWKAVIQDSEEANQAAVWLFGELRGAKRVLFYRVNVGTSIYQKVNVVQPTVSMFLDPLNFSSQGCVSSVEKRVRELLAKRERKEKEKKILQGKIRDGRALGFVMGELGLPLVGESMSVQDPFGPGSSAGYTMSPIELAFDELEEQDIFNEGGLSVDNFIVVQGGSDGISEDLIEKLRERLGTDGSVRVMDSIGRIQVGYLEESVIPGEELGEEVDGGGVKSLLSKIGRKQNEIFEHARLKELTRQMAARQLKMDDIMAKLARALSGERISGFDPIAARAELAALQEMDMEANVRLEDIEFTTASGEKISGDDVVDENDEKDVEEKIKKNKESEEISADNKEDKDKESLPDRRDEKLTEAQQSFIDKMEKMKEMVTSAMDVASNVLKHWDSSEDRLKVDEMSTEEISSLKGDFQQMVDSRSEFNTDFTEWREDLDMNNPIEFAVGALADVSKEIFDSKFDEVTALGDQAFANLNQAVVDSGGDPTIATAISTDPTITLPLSSDPVSPVTGIAVTADVETPSMDLSVDQKDISKPVMDTNPGGPIEVLIQAPRDDVGSSDQTPEIRQVEPSEN